MDVLSVILAGGMGRGLGVLCEARPKALLPFGGRYRLIDFSLSNLANSGLKRAGVAVQFQADALDAYLGAGEAWGLDLQTWRASRERTGQEAYVGTADAVYQNRRFIRETGCDTVLILAADFLYRLDFRALLRFHQETGAGLTIAARVVPVEEQGRYGMLAADAAGKITAFAEKPAETTPYALGSMGMYAFQTEFLLDALEADAGRPGSHHDFGRDVIGGIVAAGAAYAYRYDGCWLDLGSIEAYWQAQMDLLKEAPALDLHDPSWSFVTRAAQRPPTRVRGAGRVTDSLVAEGCTIEGEVTRSVLAPGVRVEAGAVVRDAVLLADSLVRSGALVEGGILDEGAEVGARPGGGEGINVVTKGSFSA